MEIFSPTKEKKFVWSRGRSNLMIMAYITVLAVMAFVVLFYLFPAGMLDPLTPSSSPSPSPCCALAPFPPGGTR